MKLLIAPLAVFLALSPVAAQDLTTGSQAPDFSLRYATRDSIAREPLSLSEAVKHSRVLLAFYPADWSSGCTKEVCSMRDDIAALDDLGIEVLALSGDYVYSHFAWAKHHDLPFRLLSDHTHDVARAFHVFDESSNMNRRSVFVVDSTMRVLYADPSYSVRDEADYEALKDFLRRPR